MRRHWLEELGGVAVAAVVFGLFLFFGTILQLTIDSRDGTTVCYEQAAPAGVKQSETSVRSLSISWFPLALQCNWERAEGGTTSVIWPSLVPTFVSNGGLLLAIGGVVVLRENRQPQ